MAKRQITLCTIFTLNHKPILSKLFAQALYFAVLALVTPVQSMQLLPVLGAGIQLVEALLQALQQDVLRRAREIAAGSPLTIDRDNDKNPVVALREIADDTVVPDELRETIITTLQRVDERTEAEDEAETVALLASPQHMNMAEAELIRALQSDRDGGQEERY